MTQHHSGIFHGSGGLLGWSSSHKCHFSYSVMVCPVRIQGCSEVCIFLSRYTKYPHKCLGYTILFAGLHSRSPIVQIQACTMGRDDLTEV